MLYLQGSYYEASPKAISRRTSYLRVRLEFLRYPQLIPTFFNRCLVRSSMNFYVHFNLAMDRSPGFGSALYYFVALFRLASYLNCTLSACKHRVSGSLSLPSRGSFHLSLTVLCAIGHHPCLALGGGPPCFPPDFSCPAVLWYRLSSFSSLTWLLHSLAGLSFPILLQ